MIRTAFTLFAGSLAYGFGWFAAEARGIPHMAVAVAFAALGVALQLLYARRASEWFHQIGMNDSTRARLKSDRGVLPLGIAVIGMGARVCFVAGLLIPVLAALGWVRHETLQIR